MPSSKTSHSVFRRDRRSLDVCFTALDLVGVPCCSGPERAGSKEPWFICSSSSVAGLLPPAVISPARPPFFASLLVMVSTAYVGMTRRVTAAQSVPPSPLFQSSVCVCVSSVSTPPPSERRQHPGVVRRDHTCYKSNKKIKKSGTGGHKPLPRHYYPALFQRPPCCHLARQTTAPGNTV